MRNSGIAPYSVSSSSAARSPLVGRLCGPRRIADTDRVAFSACNCCCVISEAPGPPGRIACPARSSIRLLRQPEAASRANSSHASAQPACGGARRLEPVPPADRKNRIVPRRCWRQSPRCAGFLKAPPISHDGANPEPDGSRGGAVNGLRHDPTLQAPRPSSGSGRRTAGGGRLHDAEIPEGLFARPLGNRHPNFPGAGRPE